MKLRDMIEREIGERGPIPFSRYMELCLYQPEYGYYSRPAEQFGKAGDFYTSSDVHAVFGRLLARQFEEMWRALGSPQTIEILELGPGRGRFALDVLEWAEKKFPEFFNALQYSLCERSPALRLRLQSALRRSMAAQKCRLCDGPEGLPPARALAKEAPIIVFANEFFDALPVEVLAAQGALRIAERNGALCESWAPPAPEELAFLDRFGVHPEPGERVEAPLVAQACMGGIAALAERGFVVAIDYGYTRGELLAGRHRGTIAAYRQHSFSANPYETPGEQDITAHVNFTALAAAAEQAGMSAHPLLTQSQFLMGIGEANQFADAFAEPLPPHERAKIGLQLKHLITPEGLGETFQVLVASKRVPSATVAGLSGLSFGRKPSPSGA